jgi:hypothetical protein
MQFQREYVTYMAKQILKRLSEAELITFEEPEYVTEVINQVMYEELSLEDRINDEVRKILEEHGNQMKDLGASFEDAFKTIKRELVRQRKVVL